MLLAASADDVLEAAADQRRLGGGGGGGSGNLRENEYVSMKYVREKSNPLGERLPLLREVIYFAGAWWRAPAASRSPSTTWPNRTLDSSGDTGRMPGEAIRLRFFNYPTFLSAALPTDQGEESVLLLAVVIDFVVVGGDHFSVSHLQFFGV